MADMRNRLVLALDYGTTYTGIAFGWAGREHNNSNLGVEESDDGISDVKSWEGGGEVKVPSQIAYAAGREYNTQWGYDISPGTLRLLWTKLELLTQNRGEELDHILRALEGMKNLNFEHIEKSRGLPEYPAKEPVEIITDYLSLVREHVIERDLIPTLGRELFERTPIDLVVTCPTIWSYKAKSLTMQAIQNAGFNKSYFKCLNQVILLSEPVAAAMYVLKSIEEEEGELPVRVGDCFITADCGGGTVDVGAFRVTEIDPVIQLQEVGIAIGKRCGSSFIDMELMKLVEERIGSANYKEMQKFPESAIGGHTGFGYGLGDLLRNIQIAKESFDGSDGFERIIILPRVLAGLHVPENGVLHGEITLSAQDFKRCFHPCVEGTIELIAAQIGQLRRLGSRVRFVSMSGGFARSDHLYHEVNHFTSVQRVPTKRPASKDHCWAAVARGAVMHGLQRRTERISYVRPAVRNYGVRTQQPFSAFKHSGDVILQDPFDNQQKAENQMTWLVRKGDSILSDTPIYATMDICRKFRAQDSRSFRTHLLANDDDFAPTEYLQNEMQIAGVLDYNLTNIPDSAFQKIKVPGSKVRFYKAELKLHIQITQNEQVGEIKFWITFMNKELSATTLKYP